MSGFFQILFYEAFTATEGCDCFTGRRFKKFGNFLLLIGNFDAAATATERRLNCNRKSVNFHEIQNFFGARNRVDRSRCYRCTYFFSNVTSGDLVAQALDCFWGWADPNDPSLYDSSSELGVFGQKSVAWVNCVGTRILGNFQDLVDYQIGFGRACAVKSIGFVGNLHMKCISVLVGVNGNRFDS